MVDPSPRQRVFLWAIRSERGVRLGLVEAPDAAVAKVKIGARLLGVTLEEWLGTKRDAEAYKRLLASYAERVEVVGTDDPDGIYIEQGVE